MIYKTIETKLIKENEYNPNFMTEGMYEHLKREIQRVGIWQPIIVREVNGENIIIDGAHRFKVATELGIKEVPVIVIEDSEQEAMLKTINSRRIMGDFNPIKFAELIATLETNYNSNDLQNYLNMGQSEIDSYKMLLDLSTDDTSGYEQEEKIPYKTYSFHILASSTKPIDDAFKQADGETPEDKFMNICIKFLERGGEIDE